MIYSELDLEKDLLSVTNGNDMNMIQKKCRDSELDWTKVSENIKVLYQKTWDKLLDCPKEYKENKNIHYEIKKKG